MCHKLVYDGNESGKDKSRSNCRQFKPDAAGARTIHPRQTYPYLTSNVVSASRALYESLNETLVTQGYLANVMQAIFPCSRSMCQ